MKNRGMSAVIITVILVALSLIAVGVVWTFINNLVSQNADQAQLSSDCMRVTPRILSVIETTENGTGYEVSVELPVQSENPDGLMVYLGNGTTSVSKDTGDINPGEKRKISLKGVDNPEKVDVVAYFTINDKQELCQGTITDSI